MIVYHLVVKDTTETYLALLAQSKDNMHSAFVKPLDAAQGKYLLCCFYSPLT